MKFKYYLRGAGVGILVTAIILSIAFSRIKPTLSADEIRKEALKLGMVEESSLDDKKDESNVNVDEEEAAKEEEDSNKDSESDNEDVDEPSDEKETEDADEGEIIVFEVKAGEFSDVVSKNLKKLGFIKSAKKYNKWLMKHGYDNLIQPGKYEIKMGASYKEIAEIITCNEE